MIAAAASCAYDSIGRWCMFLPVASVTDVGCRVGLSRLDVLGVLRAAPAGLCFLGAAVVFVLGTALAVVATGAVQVDGGGYDLGRVNDMAVEWLNLEAAPASCVMETEVVGAGAGAWEVLELR